MNRDIGRAYGTYTHGYESETVTGNLKNWERWDRLHEISHPGADDWREIRRDGPERHGENGEDDAERQQLHLPQRKPPVHVGRPADILPRPDSFSQIVMNQRLCSLPLN